MGTTLRRGMFWWLYGWEREAQIPIRLATNRSTLRVSDWPIHGQNQDSRQNLKERVVYSSIRSERERTPAPYIRGALLVVCCMYVVILYSITV